jgi:ubiquinone/menaquinone biosynthesis C-methylase UbiE
MTSDIEQRVARHYGRSDLERTILEALVVSGKDLQRLVPNDLSPVDEFHTGGREATAAIAARLGIVPGMHLLDVGCGIGGPARYVAEKHDCRVTGIDLTEEYVRTATTLTKLVGLGDRVTFKHASALDMPFAPQTFDAAYMQHVGMNIPDKDALFAEIRRVLKRGAAFVVYDVMVTGEGTSTFPVPCATTAELAFMATVGAYRRALEAVGFAVLQEHDHREVACAFFRKAASAADSRAGPPALGIHLLFRDDPQDILRNVVDMFDRAILTPTELVCRAV